MNEEITVTETTNERLDKYLVEKMDKLSRQQVQKLVENEKVTINDVVIKKSSYKVEEGDVIIVEPQDVIKQTILAVDLPIEIIFEDDVLLVVNKPRGMVTHPAPGHYDDTLVNALLFHTNELSRNEGEANDIRPGIVHRLDKDTSGLLVVAKNDQVHTLLSEMIAHREVKRNYLALVHGVVEHEKFSVDMPIARSRQDRQKMAVDYSGKHATTHFKLLSHNEKYSLLQCQLETGRTHQIRVHLDNISHPIVGDPVYSRKKDNFGLGGQFLHAYQLSFLHPLTGEELNFETALPQVFSKILEDEEISVE